MTEQGPKLTNAVTLMRMALALVDEAGEDGVAVRLQEAIDVATNVPVPRTIEEVEALLWTEEARRLLDRIEAAK